MHASFLMFEMGFAWPSLATTVALGVGASVMWSVAIYVAIQTI